MLPKSYMDGVPVKISEQYKPPRRVTLPVSCQHCTPSTTVNEVYDFKLETSVLKKMTEWKKARREETENRKRRLKARSQVCANLEPVKELCVGKETFLPQSNEPNPSNQSLSNQPIQTNHTTILMEPLPPDILIPTSATGYPYSNRPLPTPNSSAFNISDFEPDNSSPFDNMELKTINEMEILASVLSSDQGKPQPPNNNNTSREAVRIKPWPQTNGYYHYPSYPSSYPGDRRQDLFNNHFDLFPLPASYQNYDFPSQTPHDTCPPPVTTYSAQQDYSNIEDHANLAETRRKKSSKSVPDIVEELERELKEKRLLEEMQRKTRTPPPVPVGSSRENIKPKKCDPSLKIKPLSDPTSSLSPTMLRLAKHISEMGFPLARVSRACQYFEDDKKVVEYLLQVQRMEDKNFPGDLVERTLLDRSMEDEQLIKFLEPFVVLLDLGFEESRIREALERTNCDRDKALDLLIS